jgi:preprotein translocase subunit SecA
MFEEMMNSLWEEYARLIFHVEVEVAPAAQEAFAPAASGPQDVQYSGGTLEQPSAMDEIQRQQMEQAQQQQMQQAQQGGVSTAIPGVTGPPGAPGMERDGQEMPEVVETKVKDEHEKIGRNDPCWCGSGKKYKKCHGA